MPKFWYDSPRTTPPFIRDLETGNFGDRQSSFPGSGNGRQHEAQGSWGGVSGGAPSRSPLPLADFPPPGSPQYRETSPFRYMESVRTPSRGPSYSPLTAPSPRSMQQASSPPGERRALPDAQRTSNTTGQDKGWEGGSSRAPVTGRRYERNRAQAQRAQRLRDEIVVEESERDYPPSGYARPSNAARTSREMEGRMRDSQMRWHYR